MNSLYNNIQYNALLLLFLLYCLRTIIDGTICFAYDRPYLQKVYDMNNYPPSTHLTKKNSTIIKLNLQKYNSKIKIDSG